MGSGPVTNAWGDSWATSWGAAWGFEEGKLTVPLVVNENAFYSATITLEVKPDLVANSNQFFAVDVAFLVEPPRVENSNQFFAAEITTAWGINPPLVENTNQFFGGAIHVGARQLLVGLVANDNEFFEHDIARTMGRLPIARGSLQRIAGASSTISRLPQQAGNLVRIDAS